MIQRPRSLLTLSAVALMLAACAQPQPPAPPPSAARLDAMSQRPAPTVTTMPAPAGPRSPLDDPSSPLYRKVVYFDYDTAEIRPQYTDLLRAHAGYLYQTPGAGLTLEGHTDERGTRDYNLALSDRRAEAVRQFMIAEGVPADRLSTVGYGEERPAQPGQNEESMALNRRVELVY